MKLAIESGAGLVKKKSAGKKSIDMQADKLLQMFPPVGDIKVDGIMTSYGMVPRITGEFWAAGQRNSHSIHEISYRACYKAELPNLFIRTLSSPGDLVYDPFGGRGTTALEAALLGRIPVSNDINPLSGMLLKPRLSPPSLSEIETRLSQIPRKSSNTDNLDLSMFFHPDTESEIRALRRWFRHRQDEGVFDAVDDWIRMVALNRLTGHSSGFFSIYSLPPNQAMPAKKQAELNKKRNAEPSYRDTHALILKKSKSLMRKFSSSKEIDSLRVIGNSAHIFCGSAEDTPDLESECINLVITSPPFLDVVQYHVDNWMRNWFANVDSSMVDTKFIYERTVEGWSKQIGHAFKEISRVMKKNAWFIIEVGEIKQGTILMEDLLLPLGESYGLRAHGVLIHTQTFTKTAHIWGVSNNKVGTNSHRMVIFQKTK